MDGSDLPQKLRAPTWMQSGARMRILVVDDDFVSRRILHNCVKELGESDMAANGKEAMLAYDFGISEGAPYDLILLDIMMPEMDGNEVLKAIRDREKAEAPKGLKRTLIAMATSLGDKQNVIGAFRQQCDGYIVKPYSSESVLRDLRRAGIIAEG
jgi:two-component system, chemotaxis family, chemotaxis protein CheY